MSDEVSIFNTKNTGDIPFKVGESIDIKSKVIDLFQEAPRPTTIVMLRVAFYRKYKRTISPQYMFNTVNALVKSGVIEKPKRGYYQLVIIGDVI